MYNYVLSYELLKILSVLAVPLKHDTVFTKFLEILLDDNTFSSRTHIRKQSKIHSEVI